MRYNMTIYVTGPSPKPPGAAPDPAIAEEKARRESLAISLADQRRSRTQGAASTVLTGGTRGGTELTRPTDLVSSVDPSKTKAGKVGAQADILEGTPDTGLAQRSAFGGNAADAATLRQSLSPADKATFEAAKKDQNIASFRDRTRSRLGVRSSIGVKS